VGVQKAMGLDHKKTLPVEPRPGAGPWDWRKRYWELGDLVTVRADREGRVRQDVSGLIQDYRINRFGRVSYTVFVGKRILRDVEMEAIMPRGAEGASS
jgi:hypothetical protein